MQPERWQQINQLFHLALNDEPGHRAVLLAEACAGDEALRRDVEDLISSHEQAEKFIESPASDLAAEMFATGHAGLGVGAKIGPYELRSVLGKGGMGIVYLALDSRLGRQVALKLLPVQFTLDPERVRRFEREARAASALNHPNLITIYEIGNFDNAQFIVTEFVEGHTLRQLMNQRPFTLNEALNVAIQIAGALEAAHTAGIVHRDIKPENIMLRADGYLKILDFGLAKLTERSTSDSDLETPTLMQSNPGLVMGTVQYMSPEQARGQKIDGRTDVWSLGIVLYELLAGRVPFSGETPSHVMVSLMEDQLPPLSNVPVELDQIVIKSLRKNKRERYQTARALGHDLKELKREFQLQGRLNQSVEPLGEPAKAQHVGKTFETTTNSEPAQATRLGKNSHRKYFYVLGGLILIVVLVTSTVLLRSRIARGKRESPIQSGSFSSEELLTNGKTVHAVISPDGKNIIYTNGTTGKQGVWLRQLDTGNIIEIIPPADDVYGGLAFAPDGNSFYFARWPRNVPGGFGIYRLSIFGGTPNKLTDYTQGWMGISPDGGKISFVRCYYRKNDYCSLWIAGTDGSYEKQLVSRPEPYRISANQISPDGKTVAFAVGQSMNAADDFGVAEVNIESGVERALTTQKFRNITSLSWLPDQLGLLIAASRIPNNRYSRIWQVSAVTGDVSPLTGESENYTAFSSDRTAGLIVARQTKADFNLFLYNRENPLDKRMVVNATRVEFAPNGKVIFSSAMSGNGEIWSINADGSEQRQLTNNAGDDSMPVSSPDNSSILFISNRTGEAQIWRMNADGSNQTQITFKDGGYPLFVSPDGLWVYYSHFLKRTLWRVSTKGGEEPQLVLNKVKPRLAFSRDGLWLAFSGSPGGVKSLVVVALADGRTVKTIKYADQQASMAELDWLPDGKSVAYVLENSDSGNHTLWLQSLAEETPKKIVELGDEEVSSFAVSPDGRTFATVQGVYKNNIVLLRSLR